MTAIQTKVNPRSPEFKASQQAMGALVADLRAKIEAIGQGGATRIDAESHDVNGVTFPAHRYLDAIDELYAVLDYHAYERKLDALYSRETRAPDRPERRAPERRAAGAARSVRSKPRRARAARPKPARDSRKRRASKARKGKRR